MNQPKYINKKESVYTKLMFPLLILVIWVLIVITNFTPNTWLTGWDNQHFEFDLSLNLERLLSAPWAEYQGLGAPGSHSHAADLPRLVIVWILTVLLPNNLIRYSYIYLSLLIGALGIYYLISSTLLKHQKKSSRRLAAFAAAIFYMLNLGTMQHFIVPFEMFQTQFALLPWLVIFLVKYLEKPTYKNLLIFAFLTLFAAPMAYASMLWIAYFFALLIFLCVEVVITRDKTTFKNALMIIITTLTINSFWLFPTMYYVVKHSEYVPEAKTNRIFSEEAFLTNKKYGQIEDIALNKGFLFEWNIRTPSGEFEPLLREWSNHLDEPLIQFIGYTFFAISILGATYSIYNKQKYSLNLFGIFIIGSIVLMSTNPPFGIILEPLLEKTNILAEALRFPFTKFSIITIFAQTIFFGFGVIYLSRFTQRAFQITPIILVLPALFFFILLYSAPTFRGNFIHKIVRKDIPTEYFELFDYFKKQDPNTRIANLPIDRLFGWIYTDWDYQGSGFLWYGIKQPILDRDFDRWYSYNEDYYDEMSNAIYTQNPSAMQKVIGKYAIDWIIIDKNIDSVNSGNINFSNLITDQFGNKYPKNLAFLETEKLLAASENIKLEKVIGKISIYKVDSPNTQSFISVYQNSDQEKEFLQSKSLLEIDNLERKTDAVDYSTNKDSIVITKNIETLSNNVHTIEIPAIESYENYIYTDVLVKRADNKVTIKFKPFLPNLKINNQAIYNKEIEIDFDLELQSIPNSIALLINQENLINITDLNDFEFESVGKAYINLNDQNLISVFDLTQVRDFKPEFKTSHVDNCENSPIGIYDEVNIQVNSIKLVSKAKNICLFAKLLDRLERPSLITVNYEYTTKSGIISDYCIKNFQECETKHGLRMQTYTRDINKFSDFTVVSNLNVPVTFDLILINNGKETEVDAIFSNVELKMYPEIQSFRISTKAITDTISNNVANTVSVKPQNKKIKLDIEVNKEAETFKIDYEFLKSTTNLNASRCKGLESGLAYNAFYNTTKSFEMISKDEFNCLNINLINWGIKSGYLLSVKGENRSGSGLIFNVNDFNYQKAFIVDRLPGNSKSFNNYYFMPDIQNTDSNGFNIFLNNQSIGQEETRNALNSITIYSIPYNWLASTYIVDKTTKLQAIENFEVDKIGTFFYKVKLPDDNKEKLIILNQSYEQNWHSNALRVNNSDRTNWNNIFKVSSDQINIYFLYIPQILEIIGLLMVFCYLVYLLHLSEIKLWRKLRKI